MTHKPDGNGKRPEYSASIVEMVKWNVNTLLRDHVQIDQARAQHQETVIEIMKSVFKDHSGLETIFNFAKLSEQRSYYRWGLKQFGASIGKKEKQLKRMLSPVKEDGNKSFDISDVILLAYKLQVTPAYLLQPTRLQLEEDAFLRFEDFGQNVLKVSANQWMAWVNGLAALPGMDGLVSSLNTMQLTNSPIFLESRTQSEPPKANATTVLNILDSKRIASSNTSPVSGFLRAIQANPFRKRDPIAIPMNHPLDTLNKPDNRLENAGMRAKYLQSLLHDVREAIFLVSDENRRATLRDDIEWSLGKIREDLSAIAIARDLDQSEAKSGPEIYLDQAMDNISILLAHADLESIINDTTGTLRNP